VVNDFTPEYKDIIMPIFTKYAPNAKIILYESRARGDFREGADIDIALDMGSKMDTLIISNIIVDLEESNLLIFFDIVDFRAVSESLQKEIIKDGVVWQQFNCLFSNIKKRAVSLISIGPTAHNYCIKTKFYCTMQ